MFLYQKCYGGVKKTIAFVGRELLPSLIHRRRKGKEIKHAEKSLKWLRDAKGARTFSEVRFFNRRRRHVCLLWLLQFMKLLKCCWRTGRRSFRSECFPKSNDGLFISWHSSTFYAFRETQTASGEKLWETLRVCVFGEDLSSGQHFNVSNILIRDEIPANITSISSASPGLCA